MTRSERIVEQVIHDLNGRAGFDHWWDRISKDVQAEIRATLRARVEAVLAEPGESSAEYHGLSDTAEYP